MTVVYSWLNPKLGVRESPKHGKGIFAKTTLDKDERLAIFGGYIMRIDDIHDLPKSIQGYPMQIEERFVLGCKNEIEDTDFFNHSCSPNSGLQGQIFLVAMRNIMANEEITFDYAMTISESVDSNLVFELECRCGAPNCRKKITESDWKIPELHQRYRGYFSQYLQKKIDCLYKHN